jgi:Predicted Zn-dependent protease (DUF2268)
MKSNFYKYFFGFLFLVAACSIGIDDELIENRDPLKTEINTSDLENFGIAFEAAKPDFNPEAFQNLYLNKETKGLKGFIKGRKTSADYLSKVVASHPLYYSSIRKSTDSISGMKDNVKNSLVKLKELYPEAVFPPVYFVIGALSSGGTSSRDGLIIGAEMYGLADGTPTSELNDWLKSVIKPVAEVPHIVAQELIHFQQKYDGGNLLAASIKEGLADFIAELISGKHINQHVHDFANPRQKELWLEFKSRMLGKDYSGWLYSSTPGRPNDLGYWMGYKISKSYYDHAPDKQKAVHDILNIRNFEKFLEVSGYARNSRGVGSPYFYAMGLMLCGINQLQPVAKPGNPPLMALTKNDLANPPKQKESGIAALEGHHNGQHD